jgi:hypothetical protein
LKATCAASGNRYSVYNLASMAGEKLRAVNRLPIRPAFLSYETVNETVLFGLRELFLKIADEAVHALSCNGIIRQ